MQIPGREKGLIVTRLQGYGVPLLSLVRIARV